VTGLKNETEIGGKDSNTSTRITDEKFKAPESTFRDRAMQHAMCTNL